jgi:hypothetical protein
MIQVIAYELRLIQEDLRIIK